MYSMMPSLDTHTHTQAVSYVTIFFYVCVCVKQASYLHSCLYSLSFFLSIKYQIRYLIFLIIIILIILLLEWNIPRCVATAAELLLLQKISSISLYIYTAASIFQTNVTMQKYNTILKPREREKEIDRSREYKYIINANGFKVLLVVWKL